MAKTDGAEDIFAEEKQKLKMLENMVKVIYNQKVQIDQKNNTMKVGLDVAEMKNLVALEEMMMRLKRKINGYLEW